MLSCILVDDEMNALKALELELKNFENRIAVTERFNSPVKAAQFLKSNNIDLLFLDIEMAGMDGMQFLEQFPERNFEVIFTTAYSNYALEAIKKSAIDYLLKPIDAEELELALQKAEAAVHRNQFDTRLERALDSLNELRSGAARIKFNYEGKILFLKADDILYCKGEGNYCNIFLENNETILLTLKLKQVEEVLPEFRFFRVHNSFIVNLSKVKAYHRSEGLIELYSGFFVPVSREKRSNILDRL